MCVFCSTLLSFAFAGRLGINPMDRGLMCQSLYGHKRRQPSQRRKMMTVFVANCVATVLMIYPKCGTCHLNMCASCMPLHSCTLQG